MPDAEILTRAQLVALTGYLQPARMAAWLIARGWVFEPPARRGDIPKVSVTYHSYRMTGRPLVDAPRRSEPALEFFAEA